MTSPKYNELLIEIFTTAANAGPIPDGPHFVDDDEELISWSIGELADQRHAEILEHMSECSYCRKEVAAMIRAGALQLPEIEEEVPGQPEIELEEELPVQQHIAAVARSFTGSRSGWTWAAMAVAATLLIAIVWSLSEPGSDTLLALAQREWQAGNTKIAMRQVEELLDTEKGLDAATKSQAQKLLEEFGYSDARAGLADSDFQRVLDMEDRVSSRGAKSPRLLNLRLQAERGIPAEYALAVEGSLIDYGYELDGISIVKSFPVIDPATKRLDRDLGRAVADNPGDVGLMLNYGQFLLGQRRFDEAQEQFATVLATDDRNVLAIIGTGLIEFHRKNPEAALQHFEAALKIDPDSYSGHLNAGICYQRLKDPQKAQDHLRRAAQLSKDPDWRKRIEHHLGKRMLDQ